MQALDAVKAGLIVFFAAVLQVTILSSVDISGGTPDLLLVTLVAVALLRGPIFGAAAGFVGGLLVDTATLETLGLTSLVLTVAGYWIGRYGETTGRDRAHAPLLSIVVVTVLYAAAAYGLHFMLGDDVSARLVLVDSLPPAVLFNLLLAPPVYALCRRALRPAEPGDRTREVRLLG
ncbi:MAG: rod shape-determining protein MreD [Gaiellaceae bacterium]